MKYLRTPCSVELQSVHKKLLFKLCMLISLVLNDEGRRRPFFFNDGLGLLNRSATEL